ncbi:hypothetical protein V6N13_106024 [Hibiscus sabdariffa]|uniref:Uncharacterized protein n=1 Tax=Hibiscus sabdariffa TaxID=183260 RepID=A0ABR2EZE0_9ROSI
MQTSIFVENINRDKAINVGSSAYSSGYSLDIRFFVDICVLLDLFILVQCVEFLKSMFRITDAVNSTTLNFKQLQDKAYLQPDEITI